jgi:hypothetical protein
MKITKEQKSFLMKQNISIDEVFDARGLSLSEYNALMSDTKYLVAFGVTPCFKAGHIIRNRAGKCVMCYPASLAFEKRFTNEGDLYVMYSQSSKLVKVGCANDAYKRCVSLNKRAYGGIKDWVVKHSIRIANVGYAENYAHQMLNKYHYPIEHESGNSNVASEIFKCSIKKAIEVVESVIDFD